MLRYEYMLAVFSLDIAVGCHPAVRVLHIHMGYMLGIYIFKNRERERETCMHLLVLVVDIFYKQGTAKGINQNKYRQAGVRGVISI